MKNVNFSSRVILICVLFASFGLSGCIPDPNYPIEPEIEFLSFIVDESENAVMSIHFTDGDGDLGLNQSDTLAPYCSTCEHHFNLKCEYDIIPACS